MNNLINFIHQIQKNYMMNSLIRTYILQKISSTEINANSRKNMKVHNIYGCNLRSASRLLIDAEYSSLNCSSSLVYFFVEKRYKKLLQSKNTTQHIQNPVLCDKTRTGMIDDRKQLTVFRGCCKTSASPWSG